MIELWNLILFQPTVNVLIAFYKVFGNLGLAIIFLTVLIRTLLIPLTNPSLKAQKKMAELSPELARLKQKYKGDKQGLSKAQMELYKQKGVNPAAGCLPMVIQFIILIALYQAFSQILRPDGAEVVVKLNELAYSFLKLPSDMGINLSFLYLDLSKPDVFRIENLPIPGLLLVLAALSQFLSSKMMSPIVRKEEAVAKKTEGKTDDMMTMMQTQMLYLFPLMTIFIGYAFPSGLVLYWFVFSAFQLIQQYLTNGWGGLTPWIERVKSKK